MRDETAVEIRRERVVGEHVLCAIAQYGAISFSGTYEYAGFGWVLAARALVVPPVHLAVGAGKLPAPSHAAKNAADA